MKTVSKFPRMHVSLYVSDINKTVAFYKSFFGVEPEKVKGDYTKFVLNKPSLIISFVENKDKVSDQFGHLGFQVESKQILERYLASAQLGNIVDKEEIETACCYAVQDKFWVKDPDGYQWEVYYFHEDTEFNDPHYATTEAAACCTPAQKPEQKKENSCAPGSGCC